jgi:hypothetical protein
MLCMLLHTSMHTMQDDAGNSNRVNTPLVRECCVCAVEHATDRRGKSHGYCRRHSIVQFITCGFTRDEAIAKVDAFPPNSFCPDLGEKKQWNRSKKQTGSAPKHFDSTMKNIFQLAKLGRRIPRRLKIARKALAAVSEGTGPEHRRVIALESQQRVLNMVADHRRTAKPFRDATPHKKRKGVA